MLIQDRICPRCGIKRTVRPRRELSMCLNCRHQWPEGQPLPPGGRTGLPAAAEPSTYPFTASELRRLAHYRAAVAAGFYTDNSNRLCTVFRCTPSRSAVTRTLNPHSTCMSTLSARVTALGFISAPLHWAANRRPTESALNSR